MLAAFMVATVAIICALPLHIRFVFARSEMTAMARQALRTADGGVVTTQPGLPRDAGPFKIIRLVSLREPAQGVMLLTGPESGFLYLAPGSPPPGINLGAIGPMGGGWYWFAED